MDRTASWRARAPVPAADIPIRVPMRRLEKVFHILTMVTQFGAIVPLFLYLSGTPDLDTEVGDSAPINTVIMAVVLIVSLILAIRYRDNILRAAPSMAPVLCFLALAILSALWSDYPGITLRRSGTAITTAMWGAYLASRYSLRDIVLLIATAIGIIAVASLIAAVLFPDFGVNALLQSDVDGIPGWKGVVSDKNSLGIVMATGTVTMLYLAISPGESRQKKAMWLLGMALCGALLYLSQSRTSWLSALVGIVSCFIVRAMYRRPAVGIVIAAWLVLLALPAVLLVVHDLSVLTSLIGKDSTLSGRIELWNVVLPYGDERPWLGYGYGAFWIATSPMTQEIWRILNSYHPPHAHNGWIETYLELGLVGCAVVAMQLLQMVRDATRLSFKGADVDAPYMLLVVVMILIFNMVEADLIRAPALFWPFLIIGPVSMAVIRWRSQNNPARPQPLRGLREPAPPLAASLRFGARPSLKQRPLGPSPQPGF
jgi:O-antigen ligase